MLQSVNMRWLDFSPDEMEMSLMFLKGMRVVGKGSWKEREVGKF